MKSSTQKELFSFNFQVSRSCKVDRSLLKIQAESSPCFGISLSSKSKICRNCPIRDSCEQAFLLRSDFLASCIEKGLRKGNVQAQIDAFNKATQDHLKNFQNLSDSQWEDYEFYLLEIE